MDLEFWTIWSNKGCKEKFLQFGISILLLRVVFFHIFMGKTNFKNVQIELLRLTSYALKVDQHKLKKDFAFKLYNYCVDILCQNRLKFQI